MNPLSLELPSMKRMLEYHKNASKQYGKMDSYELLTLKRTINTAVSVIDAVEFIPFETLELAIYMKITDKDMLRLVKLFEYQIEEAKLHRDNFVYNLHSFMKKTGYLILENPRNFFEFLDFVLHKQSEKDEYRRIFDGYISLLLQQITYLGYLKGYKEKLCIGISTNNELLFKDDIYPYSDMGSYELEDYLYSCIYKGKQIDERKVVESYKKYGYDINGMQDVERLDATNRIFNNNHYMMVAYINEYTLNMLPDNEFNHKHPEYPRRWVDTDLLLEKLQKRKYCLPSDGVIAKYYNAGHIKEIHYQEIYKNDKIVLLYKVFSSENGEFSGYFDTKTQYFFSLFDRTNYHEYHEKVRNFILENYYTLTCEPTIDKKKLTVLLQVDDISISPYGNYGNQPVVCYLYKKKEHKANEIRETLRHYNREDYKSERTSVNGYIRKLPIGQQASFDAKQFAIQLGYELSIDETFVRPFEKHVLKIKEV